MEKFSVVIFILTVLLSLSALIDRIRIPHPVFFVVTGLAIGFIPILPDLELHPGVVFVIFLPPLLHDAAFRTSWRDFKTDIRPISALAVSLVFFTTVTVAVAARYFIPGFDWPLAFLLGAIVSPPDAVAATGIIKGLGINKRVITILEGESLVNDASALIAYRYALAAVTTGNFILWRASLQFLFVAGGGLIIGIVIGHILVFAHKKINSNPTVQTGLTLLTPFLTYLSAEHVHTSGILSVVGAGLVLSWHSHQIFSYHARMRARAVWDTLMYLLNGFVFILIGMQLPAILKQLADYTLIELLVYGAVISLATIFIRFIWVFAGVYLAKLFKGKSEGYAGVSLKKDDEMTWKNVLIISWTGTRGVISLAAALAIPLTLYNDIAFPQRPMIIFLSFVVIFITLVVQGLSLQPLVRLLGVRPPTSGDSETSELRLQIVNSTLDFIDEEFSIGEASLFKEKLKGKYERMIKQLTTEIQAQREYENKNEGLRIVSLTSIHHAQIQIAKFQRELLLKLHKEGLFSSEAIHEVEKIMDIDELHFEQSK